MNTYTITLSEEQLQLIKRAVDQFSQHLVGQTSVERDSAKALSKQLNSIDKYSAADLTKVV